MTGPPAANPPGRAVRRPCLLLLCHEFPPYGGGASSVCGNLVTRWAAAGVDVDVVTTTDGSKLSEREERCGARVHRVYGLRRGRLDNVVWVTMPSFLLFGSWKACALAQRHAYDHVYAVCSIPAGLVALALARSTGLEYTLLVEGSDVPGYNPDEFRHAVRRLRGPIRATWRGAREVVSPSRGMRALVHETAPDVEVRVVPHGVDTRRFRPADAPRRKAGGALRLLTVTRLVERKGLQFALEALAQLACDRTPFEWQVAGEGNHRAALEAQARRLGLADRVQFLGHASGERLVEAYREADVFVLPSLTESFGVVLAEAMACGLPVVATRVGGVPEVVQHGENGLLVEAGSADALHGAIAAIAEDATLRARMAARNLARAREVYDWDLIARGFLERAGLAPAEGRAPRPSAGSAG